MPNILIGNNFYIGTSSACIIDLTPPTFSGISGLDVESRGQIRASWSAASDATAPIRYEVYIKASTATGLFDFTNIIALTPNLQYDIFNLPDGSFLQNGTTYFVGIRAIDGVNNRDNNTVSQNVISTGVLTAIDTYQTFGAFSITTANQFRGTLWANKNDSLAISPGAVMGTASYQVYDKTGATVSGMSGSGIAIDGNGQYIITPVASLLTENLDHYVVKVTVVIDSEARVNYVSIEETKPVYEINGIAYRDNTNTVSGSFWISKDEKLATTNLGTGSYQLYSAGGTLIPGLSETGIVASGGIYSITPFALPGPIDPRAAYTVLLTLTVDGQVRQDFITISAQAEDYGIRAQFSINALNQLLGTFWGIEGGTSAAASILGTASYQIYDKDGVAVAGLTQSGLTADSNGLFKITPVSAALLTDLTHYTARITMSIGGTTHVDNKGFSLLGN